MTLKTKKRMYGPGSSCDWRGSVFLLIVLVCGAFLYTGDKILLLVRGWYSYNFSGKFRFSKQSCQLNRNEEEGKAAEPAETQPGRLRNSSSCWHTHGQIWTVNARADKQIAGRLDAQQRAETREAYRPASPGWRPATSACRPCCGWSAPAACSPSRC